MFYCDQIGAVTFRRKSLHHTPTIRPPFTHGIRQFAQQFRRFIPPYTRVGDALSVRQRLAMLQLLGSCNQVALQHDADDSWLAVGDLARDFAAHTRLSGVILIAVGMTAIDHDTWLEPRVLKPAARGSNRIRVVIDAVSATPQDDVAIGITGRREDCRLPMFGMSQKSMWVRGRQNRLNRNLHIA